MGSFFALLCLAMGWQIDAPEVVARENGMLYNEAVMNKLQAAIAENDPMMAPVLRPGTLRSITYRLADAMLVEGPAGEIDRILDDLMAANSVEEASRMVSDGKMRVVHDLPVLWIDFIGEKQGWQDVIWRQGVEIHPNGHKGTALPSRCMGCSGEGWRRLGLYFFNQPAQSMNLPAKYADMAARVTTMLGDGPLFRKPPPREYLSQPGTAALDAWSAFIDYEPCPEISVDHPTKEMRASHQLAVAEWREARNHWIHEIKAHDPAFLPLLRSAVDEVLGLGLVSLELEDLAAQYLGKAKALELMRLANLNGCLGMGIGTGLRSERIAALAGEMGNVPVFLRAHLALIESQSGSGQEGDPTHLVGKRTYFRELEALGLNRPDWLAGLLLCTLPFSPDRVLMDPLKLGESWVEASDPDALLMALMMMVCDPELDPPNRMVLALCAAGYLLQLEAGERTGYLTQFQSQFENLPGYFKELIRISALGAY